MSKLQNEIILAEFQKSSTEIVRVIRHKLNGHDLISIKVYSCTGTNSEKGVSMHLPFWEDHVLPSIIRGLQIDFREPVRATRKKAIKRKSTRVIVKPTMRKEVSTCETTDTHESHT